MHCSAHFIGCYVFRKCVFIVISHEIKCGVLYNFRLTSIYMYINVHSSVRPDILPPPPPPPPPWKPEDLQEWAVRIQMRVVKFDWYLYWLHLTVEHCGLCLPIRIMLRLWVRIQLYCMIEGSGRGRIDKMVRCRCWMGTCVTSVKSHGARLGARP